MAGFIILRRYIEFCVDIIMDLIRDINCYDGDFISIDLRSYDFVYLSYGIVHQGAAHAQIYLHACRPGVCL